MGQDKKRDNVGRPPRWGEFGLVRPRLPVGIVARIDEIRDQFDTPEEAHQFIVNCLRKMQRLKLYDYRVGADPETDAVIDDDATFEMRDVPLSSLLSLRARPDKSFLVRITGDSMKDAGINDGDFIVVEELVEDPKHYAIVVVAVDSRMLIKRYQSLPNGYQLISENRKKKYLPIIIPSHTGAQHSIKFWGVFRGVLDKSMIV